ncbi:hypothetical protein V6N13_039169 [Hibiscus sabdariffa]|uniref:Uncharacterized protein n=1 Tax=Hibiscus sabdariffa TaxID=183260 RepID=A0ABR2SWV7_9ROSI
MGIEITGGWGMATKMCDLCKSTAAAIFCRVDSAFMCLNCDSRVHSGANKLGSARRARVWMCEVCEQAPAAVTCKADAAALCVTCDADIHSANPLARRHERVPVEPFFDSADSIVKSSAFSFLVPTADHDVADCCRQEDAEEGGSWLLPNPKLAMETNEVKAGGDLFFSEMDPFIDFEYQNMFQVQHDHYNAATDSVVPVQTKPVINNENCFEIDFCRSKPPTFSFQTRSLSHSVSSSSLDVGVVPDGNSMSDMSYSFGPTMTDSSGPMSATTTSSQAGGMDREARVLRYREKRKNRKFEKTIRYASRKAYAESRPRIKGRFAKRTQTDNDVDIIFNSGSAAGFMPDTQFGLVPSF